MEQIIQNTPEWLAYRHKGIGASESPIIMGVSRFKTPKELWEQKINPTPPKDQKNFIHEKGHMLEDIARKNYELETFMDWKPKLVQYGEEPRIRASLDGWNDSLNSVWECKYMGADKFAILKDDSLHFRDRVPKEYWPQLMHQVLVTGASEVRLTGIVDDKVNKELKKHETDQYTLTFIPDHGCFDYIKNELLPKILDFIDAVDKKREPSLNKSDTVVVKNADLGKLLTKYKKIKTKLDDLSKEEKSTKKQIFEMSLKVHNRVDCKGYKVTETISDEKIVPDYERYIDEKDIDLIGLGYSKVVKGRKMQKITINKG